MIGNSTYIAIVIYKTGSVSGVDHDMLKNTNSTIAAVIHIQFYEKKLTGNILIVSKESLHNTVMLVHNSF